VRSDGGRRCFGHQPAATIVAIGLDGKIETVTRLEERKAKVPVPVR
jgi:hypothetical protein